ncbi:MAG: ATP-binding protein [Bacteroidales bacterium]|nr:ATP-binding protein [Bacteroidales bacterium]
MAITNKIGPPVTGDDFFGRQAELARAHELLDSNHSLVLSAPRRIGKSSFAKRLIEDKQAQGWSGIYIDLEGVRTRDEFLKLLLSNFDKSGIWVEASKAAGHMLERVLESVKGIGPLKLDFSRPETTEDFYTSLSGIIDHTKDVLIVIDELTLFLNILDREAGNSRETEFFLNWFRSLRQVTGSKIRWIFCGSIGLHNFTRTRNLSMTINDLADFDFDALPESEARGLVSALSEAENLPLSPGLIDAFLKKIEWYIPYFIQLLFTNVKSLAQDQGGVTEETIREAFDKLAHSESLSTWSERLAEYNGQEEGARLMLKLLCMAEESLSKEQLKASYMRLLHIEDELVADQNLSTLLNMIEHDGYIMRTAGGQRRFRSPLLKRWWYLKFVE